MADDQDNAKAEDEYTLLARHNHQRQRATMPWYRGLELPPPIAIGSMNVMGAIWQFAGHPWLFPTTKQALPDAGGRYTDRR